MNIVVGAPLMAARVQVLSAAIAIGVHGNQPLRRKLYKSR
jgi:hypothetical protein